MDNDIDYSDLLKLIIGYLLLSLVVGLIRSEVLLVPINRPEVKSFARVSSYLSVFFKVLIFVSSVTIIFIAEWFILQLVRLKMNLNVYLESMLGVFAVLIYGKLIKLILIYFFLYQEVQKFNYSTISSIKDQINSTKFASLSHYSDIVFVIFAIFAFAYSLRMNNIKYRIVVISSLLTSLLLTSVIYLF